MPGELAERDLQDDFAGTLRPAAGFFARFKTFQMAADVDQNACEVRADGGKRPLHALVRRDDGIANIRSDVRRAPRSAASGQQERPFAVTRGVI